MRSVSTSTEKLAARLAADRLPSGPAGVDAVGAATVREVMSTAVATLSPDTPLAEARARLLAAGGARLPVVGAGGRPLGVLGKGDILDAMHQGVDDRRPVSELMVPFLLAVADDAPLARAIALMAFEGVQCLGVLDSARRLTGMVGAIEVMRWLGRRAAVGA